MGTTKYCCFRRRSRQGYYVSRIFYGLFKSWHLLSWGESAGAISVGLHMVFDGGDTHDLFCGAIMVNRVPLISQHLFLHHSRNQGLHSVCQMFWNNNLILILSSAWRIVPLHRINLNVSNRLRFRLSKLLLMRLLESCLIRVYDSPGGPWLKERWYLEIQCSLLKVG